MLYFAFYCIVNLSVCTNRQINKKTRFTGMKSNKILTITERRLRLQVYKNEKRLFIIIECTVQNNCSENTFGGPRLLSSPTDRRIMTKQHSYKFDTIRHCTILTKKRVNSTSSSSRDKFKNSITKLHSTCSNYRV